MKVTCRPPTFQLYPVTRWTSCSWSWITYWIWFNKRRMSFSFIDYGTSVTLNNFLPLQLSLIQEQLLTNITGRELLENELECRSIYCCAKPWQPVPLRKGITSRMCENAFHSRKNQVTVTQHEQLSCSFTSKGKRYQLLITNVDQGVLTQLLTTENLTWRADLVSSGNAG